MRHVSMLWNAKVTSAIADTSNLIYDTSKYLEI